MHRRGDRRPKQEREVLHAIRILLGFLVDREQSALIDVVDRKEPGVSWVLCQGAQGGPDAMAPWVRRPVCMKNLEPSVSPHETWMACETLTEKADRLFEADDGKIANGL